MFHALDRDQEAEAAHQEEQKNISENIIKQFFIESLYFRKGRR
jgi:hypothetical protein